MNKLQRSWVEVNTSRLRRNLSVFTRMAKGSSVMAVVKSNAYGHGMIKCARIFEDASRLRASFGEPSWLGVDDLDEALALRAAGLGLPILVLGHTLPGRYKEAVKHNISVTIASIESLRHCLQSASWRSKLKIHLKLETGLNRQGITEQELPVALQLFAKARASLRLEGVYSHFAAAELASSSKYKKYCDKQMDNFERMSDKIERTVGYKLLKHMAGTAATISLPRSRYNLVRLGIGLYGLDPTSKINGTFSKKNKLNPALSWYSIIAQVKNAKKGEGVGYDLTEKLTRDSKLAIVPVGYWHGYPRSLSNKGEVIVRGKYCKVIGRISMDMMTVDVTNVSGVKPGDTVTLIGAGLSAEAVSTKAGTINYELVTRINPLLTREYI